MWTCKLLKQNARIALTERYWIGFFVSFIAMLLGVPSVSSGAFSTFQTSISEISSYSSRNVWKGNHATSFRETWQMVTDEINSMPPSVVRTFWAVFITTFLISFAIALCWQIFLAIPLLVGRNRYYMESRQSRAPFGTLFSTFHTPYKNVIKVELLTGLKIFLGFLLLLVPGVIWSYQYAMVPYLLAENPYMSPSRAMELSKQMMDGEKLHTFVLELSFIGWYLLCMLTLGLGLFFLEPYYQATFAELYAALRSKAFSLGLSDANELAGFIRYDGQSQSAQP